MYLGASPFSALYTSSSRREEKILPVYRFLFNHNMTETVESNASPKQMKSTFLVLCLPEGQLVIIFPVKFVNARIIVYYNNIIMYYIIIIFVAVQNFIFCFCIYIYIHLHCI